jgi:hypothetical protein
VDGRPAPAMTGREGGGGPTKADCAGSDKDALLSLPPGACPGGGTVRSDRVAAGVGPVPGLRQGGTLGQGARSAEREQDALQRGTVVRPTGPAGPAGADGAVGDKDALLSLPPGACPGGGTVRSGVSKTVVDGRPAPAMMGREGGGDPTKAGREGGGDPTKADCAGSDKDALLNLPPGACPGGGVGGEPEAAAAAASPSPSALRASTLVRSSRPKPASAGEVKNGKFRLGLLRSTARNEPAAHDLAAQAERAGEWTVVMTIDAAKRAGRDWRPGVAEARRRMAEDANRLLARWVFRVGTVADIVRWDDVPGGT